MIKYKIDFNKVKENITSIYGSGKEIIKNTKMPKMPKILKNKKVLKAGLSFLIITFIFLGFTVKWSCTEDGLSCSGGYTPPDPDDVKKIINLKGAVKEVKK